MPKTSSGCIAGVIAASFVVYLNSLLNGFVYDDAVQVLNNRLIRDIKNIPDIFMTGVWGFQGAQSNYYRPMLHLVYMFDYYVFGLAPWGFHLMNMLMHTAVSALVFMVSFRLMREYRPEDRDFALSVSFMTALIFAVHPVHTETVAWVSDGPTLSFALFYLLSFYLYILSRAGAGRARVRAYVLSLALFFIAMLCKETAVTLPAILFAYDCLISGRKDRASGYIRRYLPYLLAIVVYSAVRFSALGGFAPNSLWKLSPGLVALNASVLFGQYLGKFLLPLNLNAFHVFHPVLSVLDPRAALSLAGVMYFAFTLYAVFKKRNALAFGLVMAAAPLLPTLYIPGLGKNVFAERYLYLPVFGSALIMSLTAASAAAKRPALQKPLWLLFLALMVFYSSGTVQRNPVWRDDYVLWSDTVAKSPDGADPHSALGVALFDKGRIDEAMTQQMAALEIEPDNPHARINLGTVYLRKGMLDEAIRQNTIALKSTAYSDLAHNNLGVAYGMQGQLDKAAEHFQAAIKRNPYYADAHKNLGLAYKKMGLMDKARAESEEYMRLK